MEAMFTRFFDDLAGRLDGPMTFRFVLQPVMAAIAAVRCSHKEGSLR